MLGKTVKTKGYTATYSGHIESLDYRDDDGQLWLQCGCRDSRIYCDDTAKLPFSRRKRVMENLCDYYETMINPVIVVLDERDKDREELERVIARMSAQGQKITIDYWTAEMQEQFEQGWQLGLLGAGKKLRIDGTELGTVEDYERWKEAQRDAASNGGPAAPSASPGTTGGPPSVS
jgi:hypothetical protein